MLANLSDWLKKVSTKDLAFIGVYSLILFLTFFNLNKPTFDEKLDMGGDNAAYYIYGKAISQGEGYVTVNMAKPQPTNHFPPGYPAFVASVMKVFGDDILTIKKANRALFFLSIFLLFYAFTQLGFNLHLSFGSVFLLLLNHHFLRSSTIMMSEIPFVFFNTLCLIALTKVSRDSNKPFYKDWAIYALVLTALAAYYIRTQGIAIIPAVLIYFGFKKQFKQAALFLGGFIIGVIPWKIRNAGGESSYVNSIFKVNPYRPELGDLGITDLFTRIWNNFQRYICMEIPGSSFTFLSSDEYNRTEGYEISEWVIGIILIGLILFGIFKNKKFFTLLLCYLGANFAIFMIWPDVWFGVRFILPIAPLIIVLVGSGAFEVIVLLHSKLNTKIPKTSLPYICLLIPLLGFKFTDKIQKVKDTAAGQYHPSFQRYFDAAHWVKDNTPDTSIVSCRKGNLFYLHADRKVIGFANSLNHQDVIDHLIDNSVDYVIVDQLGYSSTGRYLVPAIQKNPEKFTNLQQFKNPDTYVFKFEPSLGYSGEWQGDTLRHGDGTCRYTNGTAYTGEWELGKRHGSGEFTWPNGLKYVGEWKSDLRSGQGTLTFPDGSSYEGNWLNDRQHGEGIQTSKDGNITKGIWNNGRLTSTL